MAGKRVWHYNNQVFVGPHPQGRVGGIPAVMFAYRMAYVVLWRVVVGCVGCTRVHTRTTGVVVAFTSTGFNTTGFNFPHVAFPT